MSAEPQPLPQTEEPAPTERRSAPRPRSLKGGRIIFGEHLLTHDCLVRTLNAGGAKLKTGFNPMIPREFFLLLPWDGLIARCRVAWRHGEEMGVAFLEPLAPARDNPNPHIRRLARAG
jgi:hypothetical protein